MKKLILCLVMACGLIGCGGRHYAIGYFYVNSVDGKYVVEVMDCDSRIPLVISGFYTDIKRATEQADRLNNVEKGQWPIAKSDGSSY